MAKSRWSLPANTIVIMRTTERSLKKPPFAILWEDREKERMIFSEQIKCMWKANDE